MTCVSFRKAFGNIGRMGLSISRAERISRSDGRPSRLKKPPGIFPAAAVFSRYSTWSGKKSTPSLGSRAHTTAARTIVSAYCTITAPSACLANRPVSNVKVFPLSVSSCVCFMDPSYVRTDVVTSAGHRLLADIQFLDDLAVPGDVFFHEIIEKPAALADKIQQSNSRMMIVTVASEVWRKAVNMSGDDGDLDLGSAGISGFLPVLRDQFRLLLFRDWHNYSV